MKFDMVAEPGSSKDHQKPAPVSEKNKNQCSVIEIRNLTKDFSQEELIRVLKRNGNFSMSRGILSDKIKSQALVKFELAVEAEETVRALDGVKWKCLLGLKCKIPQNEA